MLIGIYFFVGDCLGLTLFKKYSVKNFLFVVLFLALMTETVQFFVPSRTFSFFDILTNVIGVSVGSVYGLFRRRDEGTKRRRDEEN